MAGVEVKAQGDPVYVYGHSASVAATPTISGSVAALFAHVSQLHSDAALCSLGMWCFCASMKLYQDSPVTCCGCKVVASHSHLWVRAAALLGYMH